MSALHFDVDGDNVTDKFFPILDRILQPGATLNLESAAQSIVDRLPEKAAPTSEFWVLSSLYIDLAEQIPYHHLSQYKLARIADLVGRSSKVHVGAYSSYPVHQRLKEALVDSSIGPDPEMPMQYPNFHAFIANLTDLQLVGEEYSWTIESLRHAFEEDPRKSSEFAGFYHDSYVLGAAQYILWGGQGFFKRVLCPGDVQSGTLAWCKPGPLYKGKAMLSLDRWHFWKDGFYRVAHRTNEKENEFGEECKTVALKAANVMNALEKNMNFGVA